MMTIQEMWSLAFQGITALGALSSALVILLAFFQLKTMKDTLEDFRQWNKMSTAFRLFPSHSHLSKIEEELNNGFVKLIDRRSPLTQGEVDLLFDPDNSRVRVLLKTYLNELESYCTAINMGIVHEEVAKRNHRHKFARYFIELKPFIDRMRADLNAPNIMIELETIAKKWSERSTKGSVY